MFIFIYIWPRVINSTTRRHVYQLLMSDQCFLPRDEDQALTLLCGRHAAVEASLPILAWGDASEKAENSAEHTIVIS